MAEEKQEDGRRGGRGDRHGQRVHRLKMIHWSWGLGVVLLVVLYFISRAIEG